MKAKETALMVKQGNAAKVLRRGNRVIYVSEAGAIVSEWQDETGQPAHYTNIDATSWKFILSDIELDHCQIVKEN